ncbi:ABC transporter permease [Nonomuraea angiospora]|uniref:Peptide/nickel transport system permease protein n=1 Tax=Nonomuraea angiospora TaxID=46172 RepID=A0ABR9LWE0_9ACTN|nr:ABC transporter permease [Nonomuraea angiospora]MBE1584650.1 peptide/nickel transport system permease protein [Nonomuraea angiospora]MDX3110695.1 ABC transporter permease [Nonomuraea angiospora]
MAVVAYSPSTSRARVTSALLRDRGAVLSTAFLSLIVLMAICAPLISAITGHGPNDFDTAAVNTDLGGVPHGSLGGISAEHLLGVEPQNGRDILARIAYGARVSLLIAASATVLTTLLGVVLGMLAGFYQGWVDQLICRVMDFLMAFPALIFMIAILSSLPQGNRPVLLVLVISFFGWPYLARVVRGQTMTLVNREFVEAARASGASTGALVFKEILPNLRSSLIVMTTLAVPGYVGTEAGLSFLGVGVQPPTPSWGQMIFSSVGWYAVDPMYFAIPGGFLFLTVLSMTVLGDRLRAAFDAGEAS